jgi:excisionase family DNA binding protein
MVGMSALADHTVLPPSPEGVSPMRDVSDLLGSDVALSLVTVEGRTYPLPEELRDVLVYVGKALSDGQAVIVEPRRTVLSTQEAADLVGVSRPTFVKLLNSGQIAFTKPGRHRRVQLEDVLDYQHRTRALRREALAAMSAEASDDDGYRTVNGFIATR